MKLNPLHLIDSYKISHVHMYPDNTTTVYSNFTARSGAHSNLLNKNFGKTVFIGLQGTLKQLTEIWNDGFFRLPKREVVAAYKRRIEGIVGPNQDVSHIEALHDLGYLPIEVRALAEGTLVPYQIPYFIIHNTHPDFAWITNYLEDFLSAQSWKMINNATLAYELRTILSEYSERQGLGVDFVPWQGHDFSFRGMSGVYDGATTSFAHLTSFSGSDAVSGVDYAEQYYNADIEKQLVSGSVPASEHSVMCAGGEKGEIETFRRMLKKYPTGLLSMVSDSWDFFRVITEYATVLKDEIMSRDGKLVYRPDSGDPADILCGFTIAQPGMDFDESKVYAVYLDNKWYEYFCHPEIGWETGKEFTESEVKGAVQCLWEIFDGTTNEQGYRTLDSHVGLIYGDSINAIRMNDILQRLENKGFAANNIVFGVGSYSYNMSSRDTYGMAMKATYVVVNGEERNIQKDPKTGDGMKKSATGLLVVLAPPGEDLDMLEGLNEFGLAEWEGINQLKPVYRNGVLLKEISLSEIRKRLWNWDDKI